MSLNNDVLNFKHSVPVLIRKEFVLLRRAISLKVNYEKVKFSTVFFATLLVLLNGHTCKLFENIINYF